MNKFPYKAYWNLGAYATKPNNDNDSRNLRITDDTTSIRNNTYNQFTGEYTVQPSVSNIILNHQKIRTIYSCSKNIYSFGNNNTQISD